MRSLMTRSKPLLRRRGRARSAMAVSSFCLWNRGTTFVRANATSFDVVTPSGDLNNRRQRSIKIGFQLRLLILGKLLPLPSNVENVDCPVAFRCDECDRSEERRVGKEC